MYKLVYTENLPFDVSDWEKKTIKKVFAGENCIMAITETGETLQKIKNAQFMARTEYWTRIRQIGISKWAEGVAIGLVEDGTCMISKRPVRDISKDRRVDFDRINNTVKSWKNVVQVAASDAFFALHSDGTVSFASFCENCPTEYMAVNGWQNVRRIVTGTQNSVFGITKNGEVLVAGHNGDNLKEKLSECKNVIDICPTGSECEDVYVLTADGIARGLNISHDEVLFESEKQIDEKILDGVFCYKVFGLTEKGALLDISEEKPVSVFSEDYNIVSFAVGDCDYSKPFVIALAKV